MSTITDTLTRWLESFADVAQRNSLRRAAEPMWDALSSCPLTNAGLIIHGSASTKAKTGTSDFYALVNGVLVKIAASTDMPALVGSVAHAAFNVYVFFVDGGGTVTSAMGTAGATLANVVFPPFAKQHACVGFLIVNPTGTGAFVGGTTALDDATVVPNVAYVDALAGFNPAALIGGS